MPNGGALWTVTAPGRPNWYTISGDSALPRRFMNSAICARVTLPDGQYMVGVQPRVIWRFFSHCAAGQKVSVARTSVKVSHCADASVYVICVMLPPPSRVPVAEPSGTASTLLVTQLVLGQSMTSNSPVPELEKVVS